MKLDNGYTLKVIPYGSVSPMENHKGGEIAADDKSKEFFVYEVTVVTNGLSSIVNACMSYPIKEI